MPSATVQTTVRQPLLMTGAPATTIAIAGTQYSMKTSHRLDRMSRDSQVVGSDCILRTATSMRSRQFYNLERSPDSSGIAISSLGRGSNFRVADNLPATSNNPVSGQLSEGLGDWPRGASCPATSPVS